MADLAKGRMRAKLPALTKALRGRFTAHHALLVGEIMAKLEFLDEAIGRLSAEIDRVMLPFARQRDLLDTIPGVNKRSAEELIAEIGVDMARFGSAARLASWAGVCPGHHESAGKSKSGKTRKGSKWLHSNLTESAKAASRTKGTYLSAQYTRLRGRRGHAKATVAVPTASWSARSTSSTGTSPMKISEPTGSCVGTRPNTKPTSSSVSSAPSATTYNSRNDQPPHSPPPVTYQRTSPLFSSQ